jgi:hypothetical protein
MDSVSGFHEFPQTSRTPRTRDRRAGDRVNALELEHLLLENAEYRERIGLLEADVAVYRELVVAAFDALRDLAVQHARLRDERDRLRDGDRARREEVFVGLAAEEHSSEAA